MKTIKQLKKAEIIRLATRRCRHNHTYLTHYNCYLTEQTQEVGEKIGFLDLETFTFNFRGNQGVILTYCIKEHHGDILEGVLNTQHINDDTYDYNLVKRCLSDLKKFNKIVVYYGGDRRFDVPVLRTRALYHGLAFPLYRDISVVDVYSWVRNKLSLNRNSLKVACDTLGIPSKEHTFGFYEWLKAVKGDKKSMEHVLEHNREDVISLEQLYDRLVGFYSPNNTSI